LVRIQVLAKLLIGTVVIASAAAPAAAQNEARTEVAVSYTALHDSDFHETFPRGWAIAFSPRLRVRKIFSIVGEVGGNYTKVDGDRVAVHSFLIGLKYPKALSPRTTAFGQLLVGGARETFFGLSDRPFVVQLSGGVDVGLGYRRMALRVQVDGRANRGSSKTWGGVRGGLGVVVPIGR
jgi:hypothetical protein